MPIRATPRTTRAACGPCRRCCVKATRIARSTWPSARAIASLSSSSSHAEGARLGSRPRPGLPHVLELASRVDGERLFSLGKPRVVHMGARESGLLEALQHLLRDEPAPAAVHMGITTRGLLGQRKL